MSETIVNLPDLEDALLKFRAAADDINKVNSTVNAALDGLEDIISNKHGYVSDAFEAQVQSMADALDRALKDYADVLANPVEDPGGGPGWHPGNGQTGDHDDPDDDTKWPDGHPGKPPKEEHGHHDGDDGDDDEDEDEDHGDHGHGGSSSTSTGSEDETVLEEEQEGGGQGQQGQQPGNSANAPGQSGGTPGGGEGQQDQSGIPVIPGVPGATQQDEDEEEEEEEAPDYVSAVNQPVKQELDEKQQQLQETQARTAELEESRSEKAATLERLQAAAAASGEPDPLLEERIEKLKKEITDIDIELYNNKDLIPRLQEDIDALQKRLDLVALGPEADVEAVRKLEGGETSQWIRDATRNEDNSVNCVNYVVNRMPIPPELPLNAHLWDEQVMKFGPKYGMTVSDVPLEGSVIVMEREHSYANDIYGHVMYVEKVENGIVWVTDNNYPDKMVRLDDLTDELTGPYIHYLYFPWQTKV